MTIKKKGLIVDAATDWLTVTSVSGEGSDVLAMMGRSLIEEEYGPKAAKPWRQMGYAGLQSGQIKTGVRKGNEAILMLSGEVAEKYGSTVPVAEHKVTRFDLQVTISLNRRYPQLASEEYAAQRRMNSERKRQRFLKFISSNTGDTLYVGKRSSAIVVRIYDRSLKYQDEDLGLYWRYEVEFKKASAQRAYDKWRSAPRKFTYVIAQITAEMEKRGIYPGFPLEISVSAIETKATVSSPESQIEWLGKCVAPVVVQLCYSGFSEEVLKVLKLTNVIKLSKET